MDRTATDAAWAPLFEGAPTMRCFRVSADDPLTWRVKVKGSGAKSPSTAVVSRPRWKPRGLSTAGGRELKDADKDA